jgi:hypothetical protein
VYALSISAIAILRLIQPDPPPLRFASVLAHPVFSAVAVFKNEAFKETSR